MDADEDIGRAGWRMYRSVYSSTDHVKIMRSWGIHTLLLILKIFSLAL